MVMESNVDLNFNNINCIIDAVNTKIIVDFKYAINISGLDVFIYNTNELTDVDIDELRMINKAASEWHSYLSHLIAVLNMSLDKYCNMLDVYKYLDSISVKQPELFQLSAPKYKIDATNLPYAIKIVESKNKEYSLLIKQIKLLIGKLESYSAYSSAIYFKTSGLMRSIERRKRNYAFAY